MGELVVAEVGEAVPHAADSTVAVVAMTAAASTFLFASLASGIGAL